AKVLPHAAAAGRGAQRERRRLQRSAHHSLRGKRRPLRVFRPASGADAAGGGDDRGRRGRQSRSRGDPLLRRADRLLPEAPLDRSTPRAQARSGALAQSRHPSHLRREPHRPRHRQRHAQGARAAQGAAMRRLLNAWMALMTTTGATFAARKYWMKGADPFAVVNHPWQPHVLSAHVLLGPLAVFAFGWTFASHILPALSKGAPNRA